MNIFRKKTILAGDAEARGATDSINALRASLAEGAAQQELAAKRLAGLSDAITRLDASRREAARLSADNERLTKALRETEIRFDAKAAWAQEQSGKYVAVKAERDGLRRDLERADARAATAEEARDTLQAASTAQAIERDALQTKLSAAEERAELAELARAKLAEQNSARAARLKAVDITLSETTASVEALSARLADKTAELDGAQSALRDLRGEHAATKEKLIEALNALQSAEYRLSSADSAHTDAMARRSDAITALRRQVEQLTSELRIKDGMGDRYAKDLGTLRTQLTEARERADALELRLREAGGAEHRQAGALAQAKIDYDQLSEKFSDALRDIEALRKVNQMQRKTLERYAEVGGRPAPKSATSPEAVRPVRVVKG